MCRNIKTLRNFESPATDEKIYLSSLQFVRKLSGFTHPSKANEAAFDRAVDKVSRAGRELIDTSSPTHRHDAPVVGLALRLGASATAIATLQGFCASVVTLNAGAARSARCF